MKHIKIILIIAIVTVVALTAAIITLNFIHNGNNAQTQLSLAYKLLDEGKYEEAIVAFEKVIKIDDKNIEARIGISKAYVKLEDFDKAEEILIEALEVDKNNQNVYEELIDVYKFGNKRDKLNKLIEDLEGIGLQETADKIRPDKPKSNQESGLFSKPIEIVLTGEGTIYYTLDGSKPSINSYIFDRKISLTEEKAYILNAISINKDGIESKVSTFNYTIKFDDLNPPTTNIAAGTYTSEQKIRLANPNHEGTVYYSLDGREPHTKYTNEIKIDKTVTLKAIVKNETTGKTSSTATWKYEIKQQRNEQRPTANNNSTNNSVNSNSQATESPFVDVAIQSGTGYTMKRFFSDLFGFEVESSYMRGVGIPVDESAWNKEVSQSEWNSWMTWRKNKYGY